MSGLFQALIPAATVGTERHAGPWPLPDGAVGDVARQALDQAPDAARGLLRAAAVLATCAAAGVQAPVWTEPLPEPAAPERLPEPASTEGVEAVAWALRSGLPRLQHEALQQLRRAGLRLPPRLLPLALDAGRHAVALREPLQATLGDRGLWLASQRAEWAFAAGARDGADDEATWTDGTLDQRRAWLVRARQSDPGAARERLAAALPELPARERAELVTALAEGLSPADEPLLERLRTDRSREVRQSALPLLLRLPEAAHPQRAAARLAALLSEERGLLRRRWVIDAPPAAAPDWAADQVDPDRPKHEALGERAWWLYQLVRQVPLAWWTAHTALSPAALLAWAAGTDWADALVRGWADVLFAAPSHDWCEALLDAWPPVLRDGQARVLALLPPARRDRHLLRDARGAMPIGAALGRALQACPHGHVLSQELSSALAQALIAPARDGQLSTDHGLRSQWIDLAGASHPDGLVLLTALPRRDDDSPACLEARHTVEQIVKTRHLLNTLSPTRTP